MSNAIITKRGNTVLRTINPTCIVGGAVEPYILQSGEQLIFTLKASAEKSAEEIIQKIYTNADYDENNKITLKLTPSETDLAPGTYYYACSLQRPSGTSYDLFDFINDVFIVERTSSEAVTI